MLHETRSGVGGGGESRQSFVDSIVVETESESHVDDLIGDTDAAVVAVGAVGTGFVDEVVVVVVDVDGQRVGRRRDGRL